MSFYGNNTIKNSFFQLYFGSDTPTSSTSYIQIDEKKANDPRIWFLTDEKFILNRDQDGGNSSYFDYSIKLEHAKVNKSDPESDNGMITLNLLNTQNYKLKNLKFDPTGHIIDAIDDNNNVVVLTTENYSSAIQNLQAICLYTVDEQGNIINPALSQNSVEQDEGGD